MLLRSNHEGVQKLIDNFENQVEEIKSNALSMSWYLRGGASYEDILNMSVSERRMISKIIEQNLETTKQSNLPFF